MATHDDHSANYQEWFSQKPEVPPGQLDLLGTAGAEPDAPATPAENGKGSRKRPPRQRGGKGRRRSTAPDPPQPQRPVLLQRPPKRAMTVAEVVAQRLEQAQHDQSQHP